MPRPRRTKRKASEMSEESQTLPPAIRRRVLPNWRLDEDLMKELDDYLMPIEQYQQLLKDLKIQEAKVSVFPIQTKTGYLCEFDIGANMCVIRDKQGIEVERGWFLKERLAWLLGVELTEEEQITMDNAVAESERRYERIKRKEEIEEEKAKEAAEQAAQVALARRQAEEERQQQLLRQKEQYIDYLRQIGKYNADIHDQMYVENLETIVQMYKANQATRSGETDDSKREEHVGPIEPVRADQRRAVQPRREFQENIDDEIEIINPRTTPVRFGEHGLRRSVQRSIGEVTIWKRASDIIKSVRDIQITEDIRNGLDLVNPIKDPFRDLTRLVQEKNTFTTYEAFRRQLEDFGNLNKNDVKMGNKRTQKNIQVALAFIRSPASTRRMIKEQVDILSKLTDDDERKRTLKPIGSLSGNTILNFIGYIDTDRFLANAIFCFKLVEVFDQNRVNQEAGMGLVQLRGDQLIEPIRIAMKTDGVITMMKDRLDLLDTSKESVRAQVEEAKRESERVANLYLSKPEEPPARQPVRDEDFFTRASFLRY